MGDKPEKLAQQTPYAKEQAENLDSELDLYVRIPPKSVRAVRMKPVHVGRVQPRPFDLDLDDTG